MAAPLFLLLLLLLLLQRAPVVDSEVHWGGGGGRVQPFHPNLDFTFVSSVSSLHFLASNNFDFNKLIYHGIPWLRRSLSH
jgi:hypothetical protein